MHFISLFTFPLLLGASPGAFARKNTNAVLLSNVKSLTLRDGHDTTHRRIAAIPQLTCVGGNAMGLYNVDVMRCENAGSEYDKEDVSWTCKASLPPEFKLGSTDVTCEGYDSADDPYILKGSCAVEYRLVLTELGEDKYRDRVGKAWRTIPNHAKAQHEGSDTLAAVLFWLIFGAILCAIMYSIFFGTGSQAPRPRNNNRPWGPRGGDDDNNDPPPPYTPRAPPRGKMASRSNTRAASTGTQDQWRPGFWSGAATGAAAGAAAGYAAGNRGQARASPAQAGPSSWFGGRGNTPSSHLNAGPSSSPPPPSSSRHDSTGFGGTRRR